MTRWGTPERGAPAATSVSLEREERRALTIGRSVAAPVVLAATTVAAVAGAVLALLPAAVRGRPVGRLGPRRAEPDERDVPDAGEPASDPVAR